MSQINTHNLFNYIFENSTVTSILLLNEEGIILDSNKAFKNTYGYRKGDIIGKNFSLLFTREDRNRNLPETEVNSVIKKGFFADVNYIVHKNGHHIWTNGETTKAIGEDGEIILIKILHAIEKEKILEGFLIDSNKELNKKNSELEKIIKEQETIVYMASHDLKSPINNIESLVGILNEELPEECKDHSEGVIPLIQQSIDKFKSSLSDITTSTKDAYLKNKCVVIYFSEILEDVKISLRDEMQASQAIITEDLRKTTISDYAPKVLRSILFNLISNAVKYRSPERRLEIKISTIEKDKFTIITIEDNGLGMIKEYQEKIFGVYSRIPEHAHIEGTGIGLSLVKNLAEEKGGRVEVQSEVGKGSVFKVYLKCLNI